MSEQFVQRSAHGLIELQSLRSGAAVVFRRALHFKSFRSQARKTGADTLRSGSKHGNLGNRF